MMSFPFIPTELKGSLIELVPTPLYQHHAPSRVHDSNDKTELTGVISIHQRLQD